MGQQRKRRQDLPPHGHHRHKNQGREAQGEALQNLRRAGLYLEIAPSGGKWWRFKYRFDKKEKRLSLGVYPGITLAVARERRDEARRLLANGIDPSEHRKSANQAKSNNLENTFEIVAREWHAKQSKTWSKDYAEKVIRRFELHVFPWLGSRSIAEIKVPNPLKVLHRVEGTAIETAHRAMQTSGQVFRYAIATGRAEESTLCEHHGSG